jgi:hypothetical protein
MFDQSYVTDTRSRILKHIAKELGGTEAEIVGIEPLKNTATEVVGIRFDFREKRYTYTYNDNLLRRL